MIIYKATNTINGKVYIGQTKRELKVRIEAHYSTAKREPWRPICKMLTNTPPEMVVWEVIDTATTAAKLSKKEKGYIKKYKSENPRYGYNSPIGTRRNGDALSTGPKKYWDNYWELIN